MTRLMLSLYCSLRGGFFFQQKKGRVLIAKAVFLLIYGVAVAGFYTHRSFASRDVGIMGWKVYRSHWG